MAAPATQDSEGPWKHRNWQRLDSPERAAKARELSDALSVTRATAQVLVNRSIETLSDAQKFLRPTLASLPDPNLLAGMDDALQALIMALEGKKRICVHGDYDADGVTGTAVLTEVLRSVGANVFPFTPHRKHHGYGLTQASLDEVIQKGAEVIITADCGTSNHDEIETAEARGVRVIVTDHHTMPDTLPCATAIINPKRPDCQFPEKVLCGAGVAFYLAMGLRRALRQVGWFDNDHQEPDLKALLDLVALGTIGDIVPLTGVNRALVQEGLKLLSAGTRPGIRTLKNLAGIAAGPLTERDVSFGIIPRINAAGRLDDADVALDLLLAKSVTEAHPLAAELESRNLQRKEIEQVSFEQALKKVKQIPDLHNTPALVLADEQWNPGVIGIVAARLVERFHRPVALIAIGEHKGSVLGRSSVRSIPGVDVYACLKASSSHLLAFGGHQAAAGFSINPVNIDPFRKAFVQAARDFMKEVQEPRLELDTTLHPSEIGPSFLEELAALGPHGPGNPEPLFVLEDVHAHAPRIVGKKHLKFKVTAGKINLSAIGFNLAQHASHLPAQVDLAVLPQINVWQGRASTQLKVRDLRPNTPPTQP